MYIFKKIFLFVIITISFNIYDLYSQDDWKTGWQNALAKLDSMFYRQQAQFRLMQSYQNEATEELILKDIDTLIVFRADVNSHIDFANNYKFSADADAINASETIRLKVEGLKEYFEQCRMQIHVNNNILQKYLKNESLDFKVKQIDELTLKNYAPVLNN
ncbi:MAG: hypothetical protein UZ05_CHB002000807 [Chlorobi bacterium OLB5]|nr:MAG: hypothetical protein UZ05_CHB002000807 [Chlorobi bacterium OLB5]